MLFPFRLAAESRGETVMVAFLKANRTDIGLAQATRGREQIIEHRLQIERRTVDELEHLGSGGLLLPATWKAPRALGKRRLELGELAGVVGEFPLHRCIAPRPQKPNSLITGKKAVRPQAVAPLAFGRRRCSSSRGMISTKLQGR